MSSDLSTLIPQFVIDKISSQINIAFSKMIVNGVIRGDLDILDWIPRHLRYLILMDSNDKPHHALDIIGPHIQVMKELPNKIRFVDGDVNLSNLGLETTKNFPDEIANSAAFKCPKNRLKNLIGLPKQVGWLDCSDNLLSDLRGCPQISSVETAERIVICRNNNVTSLIGLPFSVKIDLSGNRTPISDRMRAEARHNCSEIIDENSFESHEQSHNGQVSRGPSMQIVRIRDADSW